MPVPEGYILFIVMEKVPGESLVDFWYRPPEDREKIRRAFRRSIEELYSHGGMQRDEGLRNLHYDAKSDKWYVIPMCCGPNDGR
ncbi:predicted protein [Uncinocarpus reesii 1704]|uniref:Protein kinase domain-containing protein n=1 Tax=Uncinocarpus reesii (strain UAMH 1704) TaxID=336963 RepID=C4JZL5_UNCRE|nr:uncharacterized protein UREG_07616 [Uncinocarpus reesii 1704]EEP82751.1 predicted protein [Uncinocarpus reesii 1704]